MKNLRMLALLALLSGLIGIPAMAAPQPAGNVPASGQAVRGEAGTEVVMSKGRTLHKDYFKKREEQKSRRDAALKVRTRNVMGNNPGRTGM